MHINLHAIGVTSTQSLQGCKNIKCSYNWLVVGVFIDLLKSAASALKM
jgi:hypothetical protein